MTYTQHGINCDFTAPGPFIVLSGANPVNAIKYEQNKKPYYKPQL